MTYFVFIFNMVTMKVILDDHYATKEGVKEICSSL